MIIKFPPSVVPTRCHTITNRYLEHTPHGVTAIVDTARLWATSTPDPRDYMTITKMAARRAGRDA